jgi:predicted nucleic acid-binding protein
LTTQPLTTVVYDAGALVAAERDDREFLTVHLTFVTQERVIVVPSPVLTQVWRGGDRQVGLSQLLRACVIEPTSEATARKGGVILGRSRSSDAVDAIVVATALAHDALIATSDPRDIALLWTASGFSPRTPAILAV